MVSHRRTPPETIVRAMEVMLQPQPGGEHDDHIHIRTACTPAEVVSGCELTGPKREWIESRDLWTLEPPPGDDELAASLMTKLGDDRSASR